MEKICGIYKITNNINHKIYIGQSVNIYKRWNRHKTSYKNKNSKEYNTSLYEDMRNFNIENFSFEIIEECSRSELDKKEEYWTRFYKSYKDEFGYNYSIVQHTPMKLNFDTVEKIIAELKTSKESSEIIAKKYGISETFLTDINRGKCWHNDNEIYPLRKKRISIIKFDDNFCKMCGKKINKQSTYCSECYHISIRKVERPEREKLKELIRNTPFITIGKMYNVSDKAIEKWCKYYNLPHLHKDIIKYSDDEWNDI